MSGVASAYHVSMTSLLVDLQWKKPFTPRPSGAVRDHASDRLRFLGILMSVRRSMGFGLMIASLAVAILDVLNREWAGAVFQLLPFCAGALMGLGAIERGRNALPHEEVP